MGQLYQREGPMCEIIQRQPYSSDLGTKEWGYLKPLVPMPKPGGRPPKYARLEIVNAILYLVRTGCAWRLLPHDFPPWRIVYHYFSTWRRDGTWTRIHDVLRSQVRIAEGHEPEPSAVIMDSQSVKTTEKGGIHGYDAGKKVNGRKRHLLVDTLGLVIAVVVHAANIQDRDGAKSLLSLIRDRFMRIQLIWADGGYAGRLIQWVSAMRPSSHLKLEIVKRSDQMKGFHVLPRRWVVERTFGWLGRHRRLSKDYEYLTETSESMIRLAMIKLMAGRLAAK